MGVTQSITVDELNNQLTTLFEKAGTLTSPEEARNFSESVKGKLRKFEDRHVIKAPTFVETRKEPKRVYMACDARPNEY